MSITLLSILGLTSLPSVANSLSWKEFVTIQSKLGWASLIFAFVHLSIVKWDTIISAPKCYVLFDASQVRKH